MRRVDVFELDNLIGNELANMVIFHVNMLRSAVKNWVFGQCEGALVVTVYCNCWAACRVAQENLDHCSKPDGLSAGVAHPDIFCLGG